MAAVSLPATIVATVLACAVSGWSYGRRPLKTYAATFVLTFIAAYAFGLYVGPDPGRSFAIVCGFVAGLCFVATSLATNYLFEQRPAALMFIHGGYHVVRFTLIGVAFAFLG